MSGLRRRVTKFPNITSVDVRSLIVRHEEVSVVARIA